MLNNNVYLHSSMEKQVYTVDKSHGQAVNTLTVFGRSQVQFWPRDQLSRLRFFVIFLSPSRQVPGWYLKISPWLLRLKSVPCTLALMDQSPVCHSRMLPPSTTSTPKVGFLEGQKKKTNTVYWYLCYFWSVMKQILEADTCTRLTQAIADTQTWKMCLAGLHTSGVRTFSGV
jgi:hypothetical protein